jgi:hypothetical protein
MITVEWCDTEHHREDIYLEKMLYRFMSPDILYITSITQETMFCDGMMVGHEFCSSSDRCFYIGSNT